MIEALRERDYEIVGIAGSSMGALVGGVEAAGRLDELADWAKSLTNAPFCGCWTRRSPRPGCCGPRRCLDEVRDILGPVTIEELPIPYTAVATGLLTGKSVWFQRGPIDAAIRASIAIPGVIAPHDIDADSSDP